MRRIVLILSLVLLLVGLGTGTAIMTDQGIVQNQTAQIATTTPITSFVDAFIPTQAAAVDYEVCCRLGNPGCCMHILMELWWDGQIDFPV